MNSPYNIKIKDYNYPLPDERIAKYPLEKRDESKLLLYRQGNISHDTFKNVAEYLPSGALLIYNNTRVIHARLHFRKETGASIEVFLLEPDAPCDYEQIFQTRGMCQWVCMIGNLKKWHEGIILSQQFEMGSLTVTLSVERQGEKATGHVCQFRWSAADTVTGKEASCPSFAEILDALGELPIPPYLNRKSEESDLTTYQTVYSKIKGSVAAPTAGLHFTPEVLNSIDAKGIEREEVTLHVGAGTFKPVKSEEIQGHEMHREFISVRSTTIQHLIDHDGKAIAVGTTSVRTLESLYYIGCKLLRNPELEESQLVVEQWEPYTGQQASGLLSHAVEQNTSAAVGQNWTSDGQNRTSVDQNSAAVCQVSATNEPTSVEALQAILDWLKRNGLSTLRSSTKIIIVPGYKYHIVQMLITNFHQPQSTLLLLVSALIGDDWHKVYDYALGNEFRFLSYGDSSLLMP